MNLDLNSLISFLGRSSADIQRQIADTEKLIAKLMADAARGHEVTSRLVSAKNHLKYLLEQLK